MGSGVAGLEAVVSGQLGGDGHNIANAAPLTGAMT